MHAIGSSASTIITVTNATTTMAQCIQMKIAKSVKEPTMQVVKRTHPI